MRILSSKKLCQPKKPHMLLWTQYLLNHVHTIVEEMEECCRDHAESSRPSLHINILLQKAMTPNLITGFACCCDSVSAAPDFFNVKPVRWQLTETLPYIIMCLRVPRTVYCHHKTITLSWQEDFSMLECQQSDGVAKKQWCIPAIYPKLCSTLKYHGV